jgi:hypothetical protein
MATKYDYKNLGRKQSKSGKIRKKTQNSEEVRTIDN